jgi:hypothetical protein
MALSLVCVLVAWIAAPRAAAVNLADEADVQIIFDRLYDFYLINGDCTQTQFCLEGGYQLPQHGSGCNVTCADSMAAAASILPDGSW